MLRERQDVRCHDPRNSDADKHMGRYLALLGQPADLPGAFGLNR
jgi:hypothetical protein